MSADRASLGQLRALLEAAQWSGASPIDLGELLVRVSGVEDPEEITREGWARLMDLFVAEGFRHPLVPMVTDVQLAALDEARRQAEIDGRT